MKRIAILILVHKNVVQLERLISRLQHDKIDIFIHIDSKSSILPADIKAHNVIFTEKQYDVKMFTFSMIDAEMELIRTARRYGNYDYFLMMSGQCYPLQDVGDIYNFLCRNYPTPFIEIITPDKGNSFGKIIDHVYLLKTFKIKSYAFLRKRFPNAAFSVLRYIPGGFVWAVSWIKERIFGSPRDRLAQMQIQPFFGPQWWVLPDTVMDHIEKMYSDWRFVKAISDCFSCDETFFQTAVMMKSEQFGISLNESGRWNNFLWFQIFDGGHPLILTKNHYEQIRASNKIFARKFETEIDSEILDMLDQSCKSNGKSLGADNPMVGMTDSVAVAVEESLK